jgi:hypothetical protein
MITSSIVSALMSELKYLFLDREATIVLDTMLKDDMSYHFPLCVLEIPEAGESARLLGNGMTRLDYNFALRVYNYEPNAYNEDDEGYGVTLLDIIDIVRVHFENEVWKTQEMVNLTTNYGFRLTFGGIEKVEPLQDEEKMIMGYRLTFNTIALDSETASTTNITISQAGTKTGTIVFEDFSI